MPLKSAPSAQLVEARARPAAAVPAGDPARGRRRLCPCQQRRAGGGRRHAGLCRPLRSRGIRRGAGAGRAAADRAARVLCRHGRAGRRAARRTRRRRRRSPSTGPTPCASTAGWSAAARLAWPRGAPEDEPPAWLVFGAMIRTVAMGEDEPGLRPLSAALEEEGFDDLGSGRLVESFARHLMVAIDAWQEKGFAEVAKSYLARLAPEKRCAPRHRRATAICWCGASWQGRQRRAAIAGARAGAAVVARSRDRRAAPMKLLRTIRLDPSDTFVFERAAEPGEWAVSGAFMFCRRRSAIARRQGARGVPRRVPRRRRRSAGRRWCRSSRRAKTTARRWSRCWRQQLLEHFGAPDLAAARAAAEEEVAFAASLCDHPHDTLIAVHRTFEDGAIREAFRTLRPRGTRKPMRAFSFLEVEGEEEPEEPHEPRRPRE